MNSKLSTEPQTSTSTASEVLDIMNAMREQVTTLNERLYIILRPICRQVPEEDSLKMAEFDIGTRAPLLAEYIIKLNYIKENLDNIERLIGLIDL